MLIDGKWQQRTRAEAPRSLASVQLRFLAQQHIHILYQKAWGKPWPRRQGTIFKTELISTSTNNYGQYNADGSPYSQDSRHIYDTPFRDDTIADRYDYTCFFDVAEVALAVGARSFSSDVLIVRDEFLELEQLVITRPPRLAETSPTVLSGNPKNGYTAFLLYMLIRRLEQELPTVVQFNLTLKIIFDSEGAFVLGPPDGLSEPYLIERMTPCMALIDLNDPRREADRVVFHFPAASIIPASHRGQHLDIIRKYGILVMTDLPKVLEIAAIVKENGLSMNGVLDDIRKWGPSIQTILRLRTESRVTVEATLVEDAYDASRRIWATLSEPISFWKTMPVHWKDDYSALVYMRPFRDLTSNISAIPRGPLSTLPFIPSVFLHRIFSSGDDAIIAQMGESDDDDELEDDERVTGARQGERNYQHRRT